MRQDVFAIEPDGELAIWFHALRNFVERLARLGAVVHHADAEGEIERVFSERQLGEIALEDGDIGHVGAERARFFDGRAEVDTDHLGAEAAEQVGVATAAAAGVEHEFSGKLSRVDAGFYGENRFIFFVAGDIIAVPLPAEAGGVSFAGETGNAVDFGVGDATRAALKTRRGFSPVERSTAPGTAEDCGGFCHH